MKWRMLRSLNNLWKSYRKNRVAVAGVAVTVFFVAIAVFAPLIAPYDPYKIGNETLQPPSLKHLAGTDDLGRDALSQFFYGSRVSLMVAFLSAAISTIVGILVGAISGYCAGKIDDLLMGITNFFLIVPTFFLALVMSAIFGRSILNIILVTGILFWPQTARLVRAQFLSLKEESFVESAMAVGENRFNIIFREILPNAIPSAIASASLIAARAVLLEAGLSFLGLGNPNMISWGTMLNNAQSFLRVAWWMAVFPGLGIALLTLGLNIIGDGLNEMLSPLRRR